MFSKLGKWRVVVASDGDIYISGSHLSAFPFLLLTCFDIHVTEIWITNLLVTFK